MNKSEIDLSILKKALASFQEVILEYKKDQNNSFVRDSYIQRFEYCYDLSVKFIRRFLKNEADYQENINQMSFQEIIREGYNKGILKNSWDKWWQYRDARNATSHSYNEKKALEIIPNLEPFYQEVKFLLEKLVQNETKI